MWYGQRGRERQQTIWFMFSFTLLPLLLSYFHSYPCFTRAGSCVCVRRACHHSVLSEPHAEPADRWTQNTICSTRPPIFDKEKKAIACSWVHTYWCYCLIVSRTHSQLSRGSSATNMIQCGKGWEWSLKHICRLCFPFCKRCIFAKQKCFVLTASHQQKRKWDNTFFFFCQSQTRMNVY